ncbi:MAG: ABC transporter substrate-binding protein [Candidatus Thiodiazotropha sp. DIVDIV]
MKKITKFLLLPLFALVLLYGCSDEPGEQAAVVEKPRQVLVATLMSHPALDQVIASMREKLEKEGFVEGKNLVVQVKNANGEINLIPSIVQDAKGRNPDVIVAVTTPVAQAFSGKVESPLVFSAVTDPVSAGVISSMNSATPGVSGVSDAWPYREQLELARELSPAAKRLGVLYNPGESASQYGMEQIRKLAPTMNFELVEMVATKTTEVLHAAQQNIDKVDLIYLSSDNTVIEGLPAALKVSLENNTPLIVGDSGTVERGGLAAVSVGYAGVGIETGRIVAEFLRGNTTVKPVIAEGDEIYLNAGTAEKIGLEIPSALKNRAAKVFQ